jgi:hypothetical protein
MFFARGKRVLKVVTRWPGVQTNLLKLKISLPTFQSTRSKALSATTPGTVCWKLFYTTQVINER